MVERNVSYVARLGLGEHVDAITNPESEKDEWEIIVRGPNRNLRSVILIIDPDDVKEDIQQWARILSKGCVIISIPDNDLVLM